MKKIWNLVLFKILCTSTKINEIWLFSIAAPFETRSREPAPVHSAFATAAVPRLQHRKAAGGHQAWRWRLPTAEDARPLSVLLPHEQTIQARSRSRRSVQRKCRTELRRNLPLLMNMQDRKAFGCAKLSFLSRLARSELEKTRNAVN